MLEALNAPAHIQDVTLTVRDLDRVGRFYAQALGLTLRETSASEHVLENAGGAALLRLKLRPDLPPARPDEPGLFHVAFVLPGRADLARWVLHAQALGVALEGASDHLVSEAIYLSDPEGNGVEIYVDRPRDAWPRDGEGVAMATNPLDGRSLLAEAGANEGPWIFPAEGRIGHVHLKVGDLAAAEAFYRGELGLAVMARYPGAVFLSWGGYHHHIALNVWRSRGAPARQGEGVGLAEIGVHASGLPAPRRGRHVDPAGNVLMVA